nr:hypothetical protein [Tanacetum cinerariifolium]
MIDVEEPPFSDPGASQRGYKSSMLSKSLETKEGDNCASLVDETLLDK